MLNAVIGKIKGIRITQMLKLNTYVPIVAARSGIAVPANHQSCSWSSSQDLRVNFHHRLCSGALSNDLLLVEDMCRMLELSESLPRHGELLSGSVG